MESCDLRPSVVVAPNISISQEIASLPSPLLSTTDSNSAMGEIQNEEILATQCIPNSIPDIFDNTFSELCSNCNCTFTSKDDRITLLYIDEVSLSICIPVALSFIYEEKGKNDQILLDESVFMQKKMENAQFPLCLACSCKLRALYVAFRQFSELTNLESLIAQTLKEIPSIATIERELSIRKSKESQIDNLLNIKLEAEDCLTNFEELLDSNFDPKSAFDDINSDNGSYCNDVGQGDSNDESSLSEEEKEVPKKISRPSRKVTRKRYSESDCRENSSEEKDKCSKSDKEDEDFKPEGYIKRKRLKLTVRKSSVNSSTVKRKRGRPRKYPLPVEVKEEPLDDEDGNPWCAICSKAFNSIESLDRHSLIHENEEFSLACNYCQEIFDKDDLLYSHMSEVHGENENYSARKSQQAVKNNSDGSFSCPHCPKRFKNSKNFRRHVRVHLDDYDGSLTCKICEKKFSRREHLARHITNIHVKGEKEGKERSPAGRKKKSPTEATEENKEIETEGNMKEESQDHICPHCNKVMKSADTLRRHVRVHTDEDDSRLICKICSKKFTREHHLARHSANVHKTVLQSEKRRKKPTKVRVPRDDSKKCPVCSEAFVMRSAEFNEHVKSHGVENPWTCSQCPNKAYAELNRLRQHMARVHQEGRAVYICPICDLTFGFKHILAQHQAELHTVPNNVDVDTLELMAATKLSNSQNKTTFRCTVCSNEYSRKERLTTHMLKHTQYAPHECEVCGKKFLLERSLKIHALLHSNQSPFVCEVCNRRFARADHLKRHLEVKHKDGKPISHICDVCGKEYNQLHKLKLHQISHTDERPWGCEKCEKRFNHPSSLLAHKSTHEEERKFCCSTCGRTFKRWCHLRDHEALHAENIPRPFVCDVPNCGKAFKRAKDLRNHANVHSGVKDNICETCGAAFNRVDNLRAHIKAIHLHDESVRRRPNKRKDGSSREAAVRRPKKRPIDELQIPTHNIIVPVPLSDFVPYSYQYSHQPNYVQFDQSPP